MNNTKCLWNVRFFFFLMYFRTHSPTNVFQKHTGQPCCSLVRHSFALCFLYFNTLSQMPLSAERDGLFLHLANKNVNTLQFNELKPCHELEVFPSSPASPSKHFNWPLSKYLKLFKGNIAKNEIKVVFILSSYLLAIEYGNILGLINWQAVLLSFQSHKNLFSFSSSKNSKKKKKDRFCLAKMGVCGLKHS